MCVFCVLIWFVRVCLFPRARMSVAGRGFSIGVDIFLVMYRGSCGCVVSVFGSGLVQVLLS